MSSADVAESGWKTVFRGWLSFHCFFPLFDYLAPFVEDGVVLVVERYQFRLHNLHSWVA